MIEVDILRTIATKVWHKNILKKKKVQIESAVYNSAYFFFVSMLEFEPKLD